MKVPALQEMCAKKLRDDFWFDSSFLRRPDSAKVLLVCQNVLPQTSHFWLQIAERAKIEDVPAIRASGISSMELPNYGCARTIGTEILERSLREFTYRESNLDLAKSILPCIAQEDIEAIAERRVNLEMDESQVLLLKSIKDQRALRGLLLSKRTSHPRFYEVIQKHFSSLFTEKEMELMKNGKMSSFARETICYRLRHPIHDGWTKSVLMKIPNIPKEDGKLFLDELLKLPPSLRRSEMAAFVYATTECDHPALQEKDFHIPPKAGNDIHIHIPDFIWNKIHKASAESLKVYHDNFAAVIGNEKGAKTYLGILLKERQK